MKPHLWKVKALWNCAIGKGKQGGFIGLGFTPAEAYWDWKKRA